MVFNVLDLLSDDDEMLFVVRVFVVSVDVV